MTSADRRGPTRVAPTKAREQLRVLELALLVERRPDQRELIDDLIRCLSLHLSWLEHQTTHAREHQLRLPDRRAS